MTDKAAQLALEPGDLLGQFGIRGDGYQARVVAIKRGLVRWLDQNTSLADYGEASKALLELAIERYLDIHDEEDTRDFIDRALRREVQKRRGALQ